MKSYLLNINDRLRLLAFETQVTSEKTLFVGLTISPDIGKLSEVGQIVLNAGRPGGSCEAVVEAFSTGCEAADPKVSAPSDSRRPPGEWWWIHRARHGHCPRRGRPARAPATGHHRDRPGRGCRPCGVS